MYVCVVCGVWRHDDSLPVNILVAIDVDNGTTLSSLQWAHKKKDRFERPKPFFVFSLKKKFIPPPSLCQAACRQSSSTL